jgi:hypothetical protein
MALQLRPYVGVDLSSNIHTSLRRRVLLQMLISCRRHCGPNLHQPGRVLKCPLRPQPRRQRQGLCLLLHRRYHKPVDVVLRDGHLEESMLCATLWFMIDVPTEGNIWVNSGTLRGAKWLTCHLLHRTPGFMISAARIFGRDAPEKVIVIVWRLLIASFCYVLCKRIGVRPSYTVDMQRHSDEYCVVETQERVLSAYIRISTDIRDLTSISVRIRALM